MPDGYQYTYMTLEEKHPQIAAVFKAGRFVIHKTTREFSSTAMDQAHEQANAVKVIAEPLKLQKPFSTEKMDDIWPFSVTANHTV